MRALLKALAVGAVFGLATAAPAQTSQFFPTGSRPSLAFGAAGPIVNQPIDTSLAIAPFQASPGGGFLQSFFHTVSLGSWPPRTATSPLPPPSAFPSTQYKSPIQPLPPVMPK